jgi:hypothetical protein
MEFPAGLFRFLNAKTPQLSRSHRTLFQEGNLRLLLVRRAIRGSIPARAANLVRGCPRLNRRRRRS